MVQAARVLSRVSLGSEFAGLVTVEAVAGLALLASLPVAKGQPIGLDGGQWMSLFQWFVGVLITPLCGLGAWWLVRHPDAGIKPLTGRNLQSSLFKPV